MSVDDNKEKESLLLEAIGELPEDMLAQAEPRQWKKQKSLRRRGRRMMFGASMAGVVAAALLCICVGKWSGEEGDKAGSAPEQDTIEQSVNKNEESLSLITVYKWQDVNGDSFNEMGEYNGSEKDKASSSDSTGGEEITEQNQLKQVAEIFANAKKSWEKKKSSGKNESAGIWDYCLLVKGNQGEKEYWYDVKKRQLSWDGGSSRLSEKDGNILRKILER